MEFQRPIAGKPAPTGIALWEPA
ncbi:hypothetical protein PMI38_04360, partial [Pseudomonas sp. GM84]